MADVPEVTTSSPTELLAVGRRNLAVRDYGAAVESLAKACELLAKEHGDTADQCAEAYLWYGKALLGLSREENGVLGDGMPGTNNAEEDDDENDEQEENGDEDAMEADGEANGDVTEKEKEDEEQSAAESTTKEEAATAPEPESSVQDTEQPGTSNGEANDESMVNLDNEDDVDNLQLAWEMLDLSRSILERRAQSKAEGVRTLLADVHLALGEVALESETYDKAVVDMLSCLEIQKELYRSDDRRIAETHYQIGLANSLASNFEDAITHFKNAANILETRIKSLESPTAATEDATVKKYSSADPFYSVEGEIKELKELLPEIQEKIQDMMDYKAETIKRVRETLCPSNGEKSQSNGASSSSEAKPKPAASDISHLIRRKRKPSETEEPAPKKVNT
ncbi:histone-binding protein N1/N2 [Zerene cesonia]|uniref:histone-binding protein N1/N2 n=1 Tax=Zerene cesonia TaxID=33412 RepID=UPI0018E58A0D|nr:histone-binding protein N1/N2 [Zerene cesonia]